jgi:hypothetical protein
MRFDLPGAHTDIGRGYDQGIGNYTLQMGRDYFERSGVPIAELSVNLKPGNVPVLVHDSLNDGYGNPTWGHAQGGDKSSTLQTIGSHRPGSRLNPNLLSPNRDEQAVAVADGIKTAQIDWLWLNREEDQLLEGLG